MIGRDGLVAFCNEMNADKYRIGSRTRFRIADELGKWTLTRFEIPRNTQIFPPEELTVATVERKMAAHTGA